MNEFATYDEFDAFAESAGWTDGLPVVPPEPERIEAALAMTTLSPEEVVGAAPHRGVTITTREVARYAVLAGCLPEYLPTVLAAAQGFFDHIELRDRPVGGLSDAAQCLILNGPVRKALDVNCGLGVFGPGWRANSTIGRALRLLIASKFEARQARRFGDPALYTLCFGEDEENSPWIPLNVERGFPRGSSTVTVHSVHHYPRNLDRRNESPEAVCDEMVGFLRGKVGGANWFPGEPTWLVLALGHDYHRRFRAAGWSKAQIRDRLFPKLIEDGGQPFYPVRLNSPDDLLLVAAGGEAYASFWSFNSFSAPPVTRCIDPLARRRYG